MKVFINLKSPAKRRPILQQTPYSLPEDITTLRQLINAIVRQEVETYNSRGLENMLIPFLPEEEIAAQSTTGKVGFGRLYSDKKADPDKAVSTALLGFEDGLFRVLIGEDEAISLDDPVKITEGAVLTFIRLTFLAGRLW
ncbi:MAG: hypothetical protein FWC77_06505 [Defluviitaleaceae bacterium]|nr:hypothetical protein [Defluviitaleaceae bacterium]